MACDTKPQVLMQLFVVCKITIVVISTRTEALALTAQYDTVGRVSKKGVLSFLERRARRKPWREVVRMTMAHVEFVP